MSTSLLDRMTGWALVVVAALFALSEWTGAEAARRAAEVIALPLLGLLAWRSPWSRRVFLLIGLALAGIAVFTRPEWRATIDDALASAAFIAAFFTAMAVLRVASSGSAAIERCGRFLAQQPPGRRYLALTVGGHLFGLLLNYGSMVLLGGLAEANARLEPDAEIRRHRIRRMLLAIQRGFVSTLAWSPLAFAMAVTTSLTPGARWADAVGPCLVSGLILAAVGWALDALFKPRLSRPPAPRATPEGRWLSLWPLLALLALLVVSVGGLHLLTGWRVVAAAMLVAPLLSALWLLSQHPSEPRQAARRLGRFVEVDLPGYRAEVLLLMMAGFIGVMGARLLAPVIAASGLDLTQIDGWRILLALVWLIPLTGQLGMNPILSVALMAPILPEAIAMGLEPSDIIVALTAGWALSGASSPFTASVLLIAAMGGVRATDVGLRWNGLYTLVCGAALSVWVVANATL